MTNRFKGVLLNDAEDALLSLSVCVEGAGLRTGFGIFRMRDLRVEVEKEKLIKLRDFLNRRFPDDA